MSQKIQEKVLQIFNLIDFDKDSLIENCELADYLNLFNKIQISESEIPDLVKNLPNFEYGQQNTIDVRQFFNLMQGEIDVGINKNSLKELFYAFDPMKTGYVNWSIFNKYLHESGAAVTDNAFLNYFGAKYLLSNNTLDYFSWINKEFDNKDTNISGVTEEDIKNQTFGGSHNKKNSEFSFTQKNTSFDEDKKWKEAFLKINNTKPNPTKKILDTEYDSAQKENSITENIGRRVDNSNKMELSKKPTLVETTPEKQLPKTENHKIPIIPKDSQKSIFSLNKNNYLAESVVLNIDQTKIDEALTKNLLAPEFFNSQTNSQKGSSKFDSAKNIDSEKFSFANNEKAPIKRISTGQESDQSPMLPYNGFLLKSRDTFGQSSKTSFEKEPVLSEKIISHEKDQKMNISNKPNNINTLQSSSSNPEEIKSSLLNSKLSQKGRLTKRKTITNKRNLKKKNTIRKSVSPAPEKRKSVSPKPEKFKALEKSKYDIKILERSLTPNKRVLNRSATGGDNNRSKSAIKRKESFETKPTIDISNLNMKKNKYASEMSKGNTNANKNNLHVKTPTKKFRKKKSANMSISNKKEIYKNNEADSPLIPQSVYLDNATSIKPENPPNLEQVEKPTDVVWRGKFYSSDIKKHIDLVIPNMRLGFDGKFSGNGLDENGDYVIKGTFKKNTIDKFRNTDEVGEVVFEQFYKEIPVIKFSGVMKGLEITGKYLDKNNKENQGSFEIKAILQEWAGYYIDKSKNKKKMTVDLLLNHDFIYGIGVDEEEGLFIIDGNYDSENCKIEFKQSFLNSNKKPITYKANVDKINPRRTFSIITITGTYQNPSINFTEKFEIKGKFGKVFDSNAARDKNYLFTPNLMVKASNNDFYKDMNVRDSLKKGIPKTNENMFDIINDNSQWAPAKRERVTSRRQLGTNTNISDRLSSRKDVVSIESEQKMGISSKQSDLLSLKRMEDFDIDERPKPAKADKAFYEGFLQANNENIQNKYASERSLQNLDKNAYR